MKIRESHSCFMKNENMIKEQPAKKLAEISFNIEEYSSTENNLKQSLPLSNNIEERFRAVVETASDAIFTVNSNGCITTWNNAAEKIFGYQRN